MVLEQRRVRFAALAISAAFVAYLLVATPYNMEMRFYDDAPGLAILAAANRAYGWIPEHAETVLLWMLLSRRSRSSRRSSSSAGVSRSRSQSRQPCSRSAGTSPVRSTPRAARRRLVDQLMANLPKAADLGRSERQAASRRSIPARRSPTRTASTCSSSGTGRSSVSGAWTAPRPAPGRRSRPTCSALEGELAGDLGYRYAVAETSIELAGKVLRTQGGWRL